MSKELEALNKMNDTYNELLEKHNECGGFGNWYTIIKKALKDKDKLQSKLDKAINYLETMKCMKPLTGEGIIITTTLSILGDEKYE